MTLDSRIRRHVRFGWLALLVFVLAGATLETLHGFKVAWYLDVGQETRRLLWRLGHAHGTVLAILQLAFAATLHMRGSTHRAEAEEVREPKWLRVASPSLIGANIALPAGFFLGGVSIYGGDPGPGIFVLPIGAVMLVVAIGATAIGAVANPRRP